MFLFTILAVFAIIAAIVAIVVAGTIGGATLVLLGDIIVFVLIMYGIIKLFSKKKG